MAASLNSLSLSLTPKTLSLHHSSSSAVSASLFAPSSLKPLPKLVVSPLSIIGGYAHSTSRFVRNVAISSELDEEVEDEYSSQREPNFAPELKLFVGNLPFNVDSSVLAGLFERAGNVEMVEVIYDKTTGRSRGFGFVTMSTAKEVQAAAQQFDGYELQGRALRVNSGPPPPKREDSPFRGGRGDSSSFRGGRGDSSSYRGGRGDNDNSSYRGGRGENTSFRGPRGGSSFDNTNRLYVGNLAWGVDDLTLETLFNEHGKVREASVVYDRESGRSRGFGFVAYSSASEVDSAIRSLDGIDVNGRAIRVSRAEARSKRDDYQD